MTGQTTDSIAAAQRALGQALRELRKRTGITQKELGSRASASHTYISQVEKGLRDIRWSTVTRFLIALDVTVVELAAVIERHLNTPPR